MRIYQLQELKDLPVAQVRGIVMAKQQAHRELWEINAVLLDALKMIVAAIEPDGETGVRVIDCADGNRGLRAAVAAVAKAEAHKPD